MFWTILCINSAANSTIFTASETKMIYFIKNAFNFIINTRNEIYEPMNSITTTIGNPTVEHTLIAIDKCKIPK